MAALVRLVCALSAFVCVNGHVALTYPPARKYDLDFLDNSRTKPPCGMPKGSPWEVDVMTGPVGGGGEPTRLIPARVPAVFEISTAHGDNTFTKNEVGVTVTAPSRRLVTSRVLDVAERPGVFRIEFTPDEVGTHLIDVSIGDEKLAAGPLIAKVYDASLIKVTDVGNALVGLQSQFRVDASAAGEGQLEISINEGEVPNHVQVVGGGRCLVFWRPETPTPHRVDIKFNGEPVPSSPFVFHVAPAQRVTIDTTQIELIPVGELVSCSVRVEGSGGGELNVTVKGPRGEVPVRLTGDVVSGLVASFTAKNVGPHTLTAHYNNQAVPGTPFICKAYDSKLVSVTGGTLARMGVPVQLAVDAAQAGEGNLEITVAARGLNIPTQVHPQGNARFTVSFTPTEACEHVVNVSFNKIRVPGCPLVIDVSEGGVSGARVTIPGPVPLHQPTFLTLHHSTATLEQIEVNVEGSPFVCHVSAPARVIGAGSGESPDKVSVGDAYTFSVDSPASPHVEVLGPARRPVPVQVSADDTIGENEASKRYTVSFVPVDVGDHSIEVRAGAMGGHVEGSPFLVKAYSAARVSVTDISPGTVGRPISFTINASHAGAGNLEIIVAVAGRNVPNFVQSEGNARFKVNFKPTEAAPHTLSVRFNGHAVPGSPFTCIVSAPANAPDARASGPGLTSAARGENTEINLTGFHSCEPTVSLTGPGGANVRTNVNSMGEGRYTCTYTPEVVGRHSVHVQCGGRHVPGSPFVCNVYDVRRVRVTGLGPGELEGTLEGLNLDESGEEERGVEVGKPVTFSVDAAGAGEGTLELVVSTPSTTVKAEVVAVARGLYDVTFVPVSREPHRVSVTFNEQAVPGSPFICRANEPHTYVQIGTTATIEIDENLTDVEVLSPTGTRVADVFEDEGIVTFPVSRIGRYVIRSPRGSVAEVEALDPSAVKVLSIGEALAHRPAIITGNKHKQCWERASFSSRDQLWANSPTFGRRGGSRTELVWHPARAAPHRITLLWSGIPIAREALMVDVMPGHHGQEVFIVENGALITNRPGMAAQWRVCNVSGAQSEQSGTQRTPYGHCWVTGTSAAAYGYFVSQCTTIGRAGVGTLCCCAVSVLICVGTLATFALCYRHCQPRRGEKPEKAKGRDESTKDLLEDKSEAKDEKHSDTNPDIIPIETKNIAVTETAQPLLSHGHCCDRPICDQYVVRPMQYHVHPYNIDANTPSLSLEPLELSYLPTEYRLPHDKVYEDWLRYKNALPMDTSNLLPPHQLTPQPNSIYSSIKRNPLKLVKMPELDPCRLEVSNYQRYSPSLQLNPENNTARYNNTQMNETLPINGNERQQAPNEASNTVPQ